MYDIILGAQYGSEAKGLVAHEISKDKKYDMVITTNSCQSGHTFYVDGKKIVNRQLPSSFLNAPIVIIGAGAMIKPHVLKEEIEDIEKNVDPNIRSRLYIDRHAGIIPDNAGEKEAELVKRIASTGEGVGYAWTKRIMRQAPLAKDIEWMKDFGNICDTRELYSSDKMALLEGSQGYGLSLFFGHYPKVTSRNCGAAGFISGAGLPPKDLNDIYGVIRTFPIRVGSVVDSSGYMKNELTWEEVTKRSGSKKPIIEKTTVTGRVRRVAEFDEDEVNQAIKDNSINKLVLTFVNYINAEDEGVTDLSKLSAKSKRWIEDTNSKLNTDIVMISTSRYNLIQYK